MPNQTRFEKTSAASVDAIEAMTSYFEELAERLPAGFDPGSTLADDAHTFDPPTGVFVIIRCNDRVVGCGGVRRLDDRHGEIKRMWIAESHRGQGLGRTLLETLEGHCADLGYQTIRLDTNSVLTPAIAMYEASGYTSIGPYNDNPFAQRWFEKQL